MVCATVNGKHELVALEINPEAVDPDDVEMLQDMVMAAVNEAMRTADAEAAQNMSRLTGGMNLGGLF
jgi:DNA-binding YbaB/EbfC family protein